jgi:beta-glucanase (GH16 family)
MHYGKAPADATSAVHEYRLDWTPSATKFYVDGVHQRTQIHNVPNQKSSWIMNNWVNGDPYWTLGPPVNDAVLKIQKVG